MITASQGETRICLSILPLDEPFTRLDAGFTSTTSRYHQAGVTVHRLRSSAGDFFMIFQQVTIGTRRGESGVPVIEGHVDIGAGAKILGPVHIGAHASAWYRLSRLQLRRRMVGDGRRSQAR